MKKATAFSQGTPQLLDKLITVCIVALFFGLPLFFLNATYQGIAFEKQYYFYFWTFLGVILWAAKSLSYGKLRIVRTPLDFPLIALWVVAGLSTIFSIDRYHSVFGAFGAPSQGFLALTVAILAYFLVSAHVNQVRTRRIFWSIVLSGAFVTLWTFFGSLNWFGVSPEILARIPWGIGSLSVIVIFLAAMIPLYITGFAYTSQNWSDGTKPKVKSIALLALLLANFFVFYTIFRAVTFAEWVIIALALAFFAILLLSRIITAPNRVVLVSVLSFLILIAFVFIDKSAGSNTVALGEHKIGWHVAKNTIASDPILGSGLATYSYDFALNRPEQINGVRVPQVRAGSGPGWLLHTLPTMGILGFIALAITFLTYVGTTLRALTQTKNASILSSLGLSTATLIIVLTVFLTRFDGLLFLLSFLFIALSFAVLRQEKEQEDIVKNITFNTSPNHALALAFLYLAIAAGALFGFVSLGKHVVADIKMAQGLRTQATSEEVAVAPGIVEAVNTNGKEARYLMTLAQSSLVQANREVAKTEEERDAVRIEGLAQAAAAAAQRATDLAPNDVTTHETLGAVYENAGRYLTDPLTNARTAYERARELEPRNPLYDLRLGMLKLIEVQAEETTEENREQKKAMVEEAKTLFEASRDKNPAFAPAYYQLAIVHEALDDVDVAIGNMAVAQRLIPNDLNYAFNLARLLQARDGEGDVVLAEQIFKEILGVNDREINAQFNLGLLYERTNRRDEAITQYKTVLEILPQEAPAREQIEQFVKTLQDGGTNIVTQESAGTIDNNANEDDSAQAENSNIVVLNAGAQVGAAGNVRDLLQDGGLDNVRATNSTIDAQGTVILHAQGQQSLAQSVATTMSDALGTVTVQEDNDLTEQNDAAVVVVVGASEDENTDQETDEQ